MSVDCARVLTSKLNDVMRPAGRIIGVQMRKRFPTAAETWDFDIVLAATIRGALDNGIEPRDITATGKQTDALYSHDCPFSSPNGQADAAALAFKLMNSRRLTACHDAQARVPAQLAHLKGASQYNVRVGSKTDMCNAKPNVRFGSIADICNAQDHVCFGSEAGIPARKTQDVLA